LTCLFITVIYLSDVKLFDDLLIKYHYLIPILIIMIRIYLITSTCLSYNFILFLNLAILFEDNYILMMNPGNNQGGYGGGFSGGPSGFNNFGGPSGSGGPGGSGGSGGSGGPEGLGNVYPISNSGNSDNSREQTASSGASTTPVAASYLPPAPTTGPSLPPSSALTFGPTPTTYDPEGTVPPRNYHELHILMEHRVNYQMVVRRVSNVTVTMIFSKDDIINNISKEMLFAYIFDHKAELPAAYKRLNIPDGTP
jgi:hypothetical protein